MKLDLPKAQTGEKIEPRETGKLVLNVAGPNSFFLGEYPVSLEDFRIRLLEEKKKAIHPLEVRIRSDRKVPYSDIEPILVICAQSGVSNVSFAVINK